MHHIFGFKIKRPKMSWFDFGFGIHVNQYDWKGCIQPFENICRSDQLLLYYKEYFDRYTRE